MILGIKDEVLDSFSDNELIEIICSLNSLGKLLVSQQLLVSTNDRFKTLFEEYKDNKSETYSFNEWLHEGCPLLKMTDQIVNFIRNESYMHDTLDYHVPECLHGKVKIEEIEKYFLDSNVNDSRIKQNLQYNSDILLLLKNGIDFLVSHKDSAGPTSYWRQL